MSEEVKPQASIEAPAPASPVTDSVEEVAAPSSVVAETRNVEATNGAVGAATSKLSTPDATADVLDQLNTDDKGISSKDDALDEVATTEGAMKEQDEKGSDTLALDSAKPDDTATTMPSSTSKSKARRKSTGVPEHKGKKLNKKASKAKLTHTDAKPGDYFYVRLKGYPLWPAIVSDESMLPSTLLKTRPVTAARPDGTYRADYEDGGSKVKDRTFPVMYLHTNEFGWIPNFDLLEIDFDEVTNITTNMRKDLAAARLLAAEKHDLDYFKDILMNFMEARKADQAAKEAAKAEKKAKTATPKKEKKSSKTVEDGSDEDVDMPDRTAEIDDEDVDVSAEKKKNKKRSADEPLPVESPKKVKIKINNTPKTANGTSTPKSLKDKSVTKSAKAKTKKATKPETPDIVTPKEPELTAEEKRVKKEKEILFLRHKLQKGLLTKDQEPKVEEMKQMSEFVGKLEGYSDLEVSIIQATKINKVLKAIIKLPMIPDEEKHKFKSRSQTLLDKWNKLLATEKGAPNPVPATVNGATDTKADAEDAKVSHSESTNGTKEPSKGEQSVVKVSTDEPSASTGKENSVEPEKSAAPSEEQITSAAPAVPTPVESAT